MSVSRSRSNAKYCMSWICVGLDIYDERTLREDEPVSIGVLTAFMQGAGRMLFHRGAWGVLSSVCIRE